MPRKTLEERFWEKVQITDGCWFWLGSTFHFGHGQFSVTEDGKRKNKKAHRVAWELVKGPIPDGMCVLHRCDNPPCVRVDDHLFLGTVTNNNQDSWDKGRAYLKRAGDHPFQKLTAEQTLEVLRLREAGLTAREVAERVGLARGSVWYAVQRALRLEAA